MIYHYYCPLLVIIVTMIWGYFIVFEDWSHELVVNEE